MCQAPVLVTLNLDAEALSPALSLIAIKGGFAGFAVPGPERAPPEITLLEVAVDEEIRGCGRNVAGDLRQAEPATKPQPAEGGCGTIYNGMHGLFPFGCRTISEGITGCLRPRIDRIRTKATPEQFLTRVTGPSKVKGGRAEKRGA